MQKRGDVDSVKEKGDMPCTEIRGWSRFLGVNPTGEVLDGEAVEDLARGTTRMAKHKTHRQQAAWHHKTVSSPQQPMQGKM